MAKFKNTVTVAGTLAKSELIQGTSQTSGRDFIRGSFSVQTSETNVVKVNVLQMFDKKDKKNKDNFIPDDRYKTLEKLMEPEAIGTGVQVTGAFENNIFVAGDGETVKSVVTQGGFYRVPHSGSGKADFTLTLVIRSIMEELDAEENPTGSAVVKGEALTFRGEAVPLTLYVDNEAGAKYFMDLDVSEPIVTDVWGKIENSQLPPKVTESVFGEPQVVESTFTRTRRVITGAAVDQHEVDEDMATQIKEGKQAYQVAISDAEQRFEDNKNSNSAFDAPASSKASTDKPKAGGFNF